MNLKAYPDTVMVEGFLFSITEHDKDSEITKLYRILGPLSHIYVEVTIADNAVRYYNCLMDYIGFKPANEFNTVHSMLVESIKTYIDKLV